MAAIVRSLSMSGRARRNAYVALRTMQQQRADAEAARLAVYPEDPLSRPSHRTADPART